MINVSALTKRQLAIGEYTDCKNKMHKVIHSIIDDEIQQKENIDKVAEALFMIFATSKGSFSSIHN